MSCCSMTNFRVSICPRNKRPILVPVLFCKPTLTHKQWPKIWLIKANGHRNWELRECAIESCQNTLPIREACRLASDSAVNAPKRRQSCETFDWKMVKRFLEVVAAKRNQSSIASVIQKERKLIMTGSERQQGASRRGSIIYILAAFFWTFSIPSAKIG